MERVIDTNVLVDYIVLDSELHEKAKEGLERIGNGLLPSVAVEGACPSTQTPGLR